MGSCQFGGTRGGGEDEVIKVITSNGGIMELYTAVTVESITDEFPGHGIFHSHDLFWKPIPHHQFLLPGNSYFLLPLKNNLGGGNHQIAAQVGHVRSNSVPTSVVVPYRMSFDNEKLLNTTQGGFGGFSFSTSRWYKSNSIKYKRSSSNINNGRRMWKVKLVISPEQLVEILSQESTTQELIESVRTVAKCGNIGLSSSSCSSSSSGFSDEWSTTDDLSTTRNASSNKEGLLLLD